MPPSGHALECFLICTKSSVRHEKGAGEKDVSADSLSFPQDLYEHAVTNEPVFKALSQGNTGGSAALTSHPWSM